MLEAYTTPHLTFCTDLLVAIGGLSSFIEARTGLHFVWGHWKELLPLGLLWHVKESILMDDEDLIKKREKRTKSGIFPTWSWPSMMIDNERDQLGGSIIWGRDGDFIFDGLELLSEVLSVSSDQQARQDSITWGVLVLCGPIFPPLSYSDVLQLPSVRTMMDSMSLYFTLIGNEPSATCTWRSKICPAVSPKCLPFAAPAELSH